MHFINLLPSLLYEKMLCCLDLLILTSHFLAGSKKMGQHISNLEKYLDLTYRGMGQTQNRSESFIEQTETT